MCSTVLRLEAVGPRQECRDREMMPVVSTCAGKQPRVRASRVMAHHHNVDATQHGAEQGFDIATVPAAQDSTRQVYEQIKAKGRDHRTQSRRQRHPLPDSNRDKRRKQNREAGDEA